MFCAVMAERIPCRSRLAGDGGLEINVGLKGLIASKPAPAGGGCGA